jgi:formylmethanofuran dehydrogenase subunit C
MNSTNLTKIFDSLKSDMEDGVIVRSGMVTPTQAAFKFGPGVGKSNSAMETPTQEAFNSDPII